MRIREDELLYTPSHTFEDLGRAIESGNREEVIKTFEERVEELYLKPAKLLLEHAEYCENDIGFVFSAGLICVSVIDFLGRFYMGCREERVGSRFINWLLSYMCPPFNGYLAEEFYQDFRNGLVHECRIKNGGEFSLNIDKSIDVVRIDGSSYLVVNPKILLDRIKDAFERYITDLKRNDVLYGELVNCLKNDFKEDFRKGEDSNGR